MGTSLFYGMFVGAGVAFLLFYRTGLTLGESGDAPDTASDPTTTGVVPLMIWCLDSVFNDVCAVYLGCGPTQAALDLVSQASHADALGIPVADTVGQVLGAPEVGEVTKGQAGAVGKPVAAVSGEVLGTPAQESNSRPVATVEAWSGVPPK